MPNNVPWLGIDITLGCVWHIEWEMSMSLHEIIHYWKRYMILSACFTNALHVKVYNEEINKNDITLVNRTQ